MPVRCAQGRRFRQTSSHRGDAGLQKPKLRQIAAIQGEVGRLIGQTTSPMVWLVSTITVCPATLTSA